MADEAGIKIPVQRISQARDFGALDSAALLTFVVIGDHPEARAIAAELETYLIDRADTLTQLSDSERAASDEAAFEYVRRLERLGYVACAGVDQADLRFDDDPSKTRAYQVGCIAVSSVADESPFVTVTNA